MIALMAAGLAVLSAPDETISGYADRDATYVVTELAGTPFAASASMRFPEPGLILGRGPCNAYSASQNAPYPWIEIDPIMATKTSCPDIAAEDAFFAFLASATLVEVSGPVLILTNEAGETLVARSD